MKFLLLYRKFFKISVFFVLISKQIKKIFDYRTFWIWLSIQKYSIHVKMYSEFCSKIAFDLHIDIFWTHFWFKVLHVMPLMASLFLMQRICRRLLIQLQWDLKLQSKKFFGRYFSSNVKPNRLRIFLGMAVNYQ